MLTTSVERLEGATAKLTVTVPATDVDACIAETYARIGATMRIPGFRKGKAPRPVIDNFVGREYMMTEATETVVNEWYPRAVDAEGLRPIDSPELEAIEPVEQGKDFTFTLEVELRPELEVGDYKSISVEVPRRQVNDADINAQLDELRERFATLGPVDGRGIEKDDFVLLSFVGYVDGETYDGNTVEKYLYEMSRGLMPEEFDEQILGAKPDEERRVEFTIPDTSSNEEYVGKQAQFDVTIHEIKAKKLPEVNEEFAAEMGFDSVEAMNEDLRSRLDVGRLMNYNQAKEKGAREALAKLTPGDIPEPMIKSRARSLENDFKSRLEQQGLTLEQYANLTGLTRESFDEQLSADAELQVREDLALEALFRTLGFEVTDEDIAKELADLAAAQKLSVEETREKWEKMGLMTVIAEGIQHTKAVGWLMENVKAVEVDEPKPAEHDEAAEGTKKKSQKKKAAEADDESAE